MERLTENVGSVATWALLISPMEQPSGGVKSVVDSPLRKGRAYGGLP